MKTIGQETLRLEVRLPGHDRLGKIRRASRLALRVLRARVTREEAWYELEVRGPQAEVARALRRLAAAACA